MVNLASRLYDYFQKRFSSKEYYSEIKEIISFLGNLSDKDVLEIGAGTCKVSAFIKNKFPTANIVAADISKSHLELGSKKAKITTCCSPTESLDKKIHKKFDLIIGVDTIHHHSNRIFALKNSFNLLKKNGVLVLRDVSRFLPGFIKYKIIDKTDFILSKLQGLKYNAPSYFSDKEFVDLLKYIGFKSVNIKNLNRDGLIVIIAKK